MPDFGKPIVQSEPVFLKHRNTMLNKFVLSAAFAFGLAVSCSAQEKADSKPVELEVLKASLGVWDAEVEVWNKGPDAPPMKFKGVETNRPFGEYWIASDSEYVGMKLHSIMGYDLVRKKMAGTVIDHGPYMATMTGDYDKDTKTVTWITNAKDLAGKPLVQKTTVTQKNENERILELSVPGEKEGEFTKFMKIKFVKRKK